MSIPAPPRPRRHRPRPPGLVAAAAVAALAVAGLPAAATAAPAASAGSVAGLSGPTARSRSPPRVAPPTCGWCCPPATGAALAAPVTVRYDAPAPPPPAPTTSRPGATSRSRPARLRRQPHRHGGATRTGRGDRRDLPIRTAHRRRGTARPRPPSSSTPTACPTSTRRLPVDRRVADLLRPDDAGGEDRPDDPGRARRGHRRPALIAAVAARLGAVRRRLGARAEHPGGVGRHGQRVPGAGAAAPACRSR